MRLKIVAGNWKMNNTINEAQTLIENILQNNPGTGTHQLNIFAVPFPYLTLAQLLVKSNPGFAIAAQNCAAYAKGAYTGEVSATMLASMQVNFCIVGHSERRTIFNENANALFDKTNQLLKNGIRPIWCCGEHLEDRNSNQHFTIVANQLKQEVFNLEEEAFSKVIIAYEPVWAIGTGLTASSEQAQEMHAFIRSEITLRYNSSIANNTSILYGGSCNAENAKQLFSLEDVDGGLIGGASLQAESFVKLISTMYELY
jgi:triosephosphate isomerase